MQGTKAFFLALRISCNSMSRAYGGTESFKEYCHRDQHSQREGAAGCWWQTKAGLAVFFGRAPGRHLDNFRSGQVHNRSVFLSESDSYVDRKLEAIRTSAY